ncbi:MAG: hypothetical protein JSS81_19760, partial [Acidobacteria bacterium]|nr:hypothetical protein [Acidobacteriota bacterium]
TKFPVEPYFYSKKQSDAPIEELERIIIGTTIYNRSENGKWELYKPADDKSVTLMILSPAGFIKKTTLDGRAVVVYEQKSTKQTDKKEFDVKTRYWFDEQNRLLKTESVETARETRETTRSVTVYEYDANIVIEAPAVDFETLFRESAEHLKNKSYRLKVTTENFDAGATTPQGRYVLGAEFTPSGRSRTKIDFGPDSPVPPVEVISIDGKTYRRSGAGRWRVEDIPVSETHDLIPLNAGKFIEKTTLDGRAVAVYEEEHGVSFENDDYRIRIRY